MSIANLISILRILIVPVILGLLIRGSARTWKVALVLFILAVFVDLVIALLNRGKKQTKVASFLDPFADKFLIMGLLFYFALTGFYWWFVLGLFVLRDVVVGIIYWMASREDIVLRYKMGYSHALTITYYCVLGAILIEQSFPQNSIIFFTIIAMSLAFISMGYAIGLYIKEVYTIKTRGKKVHKENIVILVNKKSRGYKHRYRRRLLRVFAKRRKARVFYLKARKDSFNHLPDRVKKAKHIIIAGGDGTFEAALNHKPFQKKSLGFFPMGGGNAYYSYFYKGKRFEYLRSRFPFHEVDMDILEIEWDKGKFQTTFLSVGVDAEVMNLSNSRTKQGFMDYVKGSWKALVGVKAQYSMDCKIDKEEFFWENCVAFTIAKIPYFGFGIRSLVGKVNVDDKQVYGLACVNAHTSWLNKPVRLWGFALAIFNLKVPPLVPLKGKSFILNGKKLLPLQAGGDFIGWTKKLKVKVVRKQKVLMV